MSSLGAVNPIDHPQYWDVVEIAGVKSPGYCEVGEFKRQHDFDVKKGKGTVGGTLTFVQKPPAEGSIKFYLWDNGTLGTGHNHFDEWDNFLPLLKYDPTKRSVQAVTIWHPSLDAIDVANVVCTKIGNPVHEPPKAGMYSITVDFLEYFPPPKASAVSTPSTSKGNAGPPATPGAQPPTAQDEYQKQIAALLAQAEAP